MGLAADHGAQHVRRALRARDAKTRIARLSLAEASFAKGSQLGEKHLNFHWRSTQEQVKLLKILGGMVEETGTPMAKWIDLSWCVVHFFCLLYSFFAVYSFLCSSVLLLLNRFPLLQRCDVQEPHRTARPDKGGRARADVPRVGESVLPHQGARAQLDTRLGWTSRVSRRAARLPSTAPPHARARSRARAQWTASCSTARTPPLTTA